MKLVSFASLAALVYFYGVSGNIVNQLSTKEQQSYGNDPKQVTKSDVEGGEGSKDGKEVFCISVSSSFHFLQPHHL